jgi:hypothetical protein
MVEKNKIEELEELIRLIKLDLKNQEIIKKKIGWNKHLEDAQNLYLDQLLEFMKERDELKNNSNQLPLSSKGKN